MPITTNFKTELLPLIESLSAEADFSKLVFEKVFLPKDFNQSEAFSIVTGVRNGNVLPLLRDVPNYESFPFVDSSSCDIPLCDQTHDYSGRKWELGLLECRTEICLRTFDEKFLVFWNQYKMVNLTGDETSGAVARHLKTALLQYIVDNIKRDLNAAKWRAAYFGDKASDSKYFNGIDGFFVQAEANANNVVAIAKNNEGTYAEQVMTGEEIYNTLVQMEEKRENQLWESTTERIEMTKLMAQKLAGYLNRLDSQKCCGAGFEIDPTKIVGAKTFRYDNISFHGVPIIAIGEWDGIINNTSALNGGGGAAARVQPNRILWTSKDNLLVGTQEIDDLTMFEVIYDKVSRKVLIDAGAYLGAGIPFDNYVLAI